MSARRKYFLLTWCFIPPPTPLLYALVFLAFEEEGEKEKWGLPQRSKEYSIVDILPGLAFYSPKNVFLKIPLPSLRDA